MLTRRWAGRTLMVLRPDVEQWARGVLDSVEATHCEVRFDEVNVEIAGVSLLMSCDPQLTPMFSSAFFAAASRVGDLSPRVYVSNAVPEELWKASPIRYGDIDGRGAVAGSERGDLAVAWNSGQFILSIMDRQERKVVYAKDTVFHPSEAGGPLRTPVHWLVSESGRAFFHAAAVVSDGKAVLLAGPSGAGKSTFAIRAIESGLPIVGDDYVVVALESKGPVVSPSYRTVKARADSQLPGVGPEFDLANGKTARLLDESVMVKKAPVVAIAVVDPGGPGSPKPVDGSVAARVLATSTILQVPLYAEHTLRMASSLASKVPCFRVGWLHSPESTRKVVQEIVSR